MYIHDIIGIQIKIGFNDIKAEYVRMSKSNSKEQTMVETGLAYVYIVRSTIQ